MKNENTIENSILYKQNKKIQKNQWKIYTLLLIVSAMIIYIQGFN